MFKLILFNLFKHKIIFILIGLILILFSFYLVVGMNTIFSVSASLTEAVSENMTGDIIITDKNVPAMDIITKDGEKDVIPLYEWEKLLTYIKSLDYVIEASPRLRLWGQIISDYNELPVILTGINPETEKNLLPGRFLDQGKWLDGPNEIMLYYRHSDKLNVDADTPLGIYISTKDGYVNFDVAQLVGIFDYNDLAYYTEYAFFGFISLSFLNTLVQNEDVQAGEIFVRLKNRNMTSQLAGDIQKEFGDRYKYIPPEKSSTLINGIYLLTLFSVYFIAFLLLIMVYLCSSFLINITIETRRKEIGIYQALGVSKWRIALLFGGEFLFAMCIFSIIGIAAGLFFMKDLTQYGIKATLIPLHLVFGRPMLYITNNMWTFVIIAGLLSISFLANIGNTIRQIGKLDPVEIMREL